MASFPKTEPRIAALAELIAHGLATANGEFPAPPVAADDLEVRLAAYRAARTGIIAAEGVTRERRRAKDEALEHLVEGMKADLRYAELMARQQPQKLSRLGWGPRRDPSVLHAPGEVLGMRIAAEGGTWLVLNWKPPVDGGAVLAYTIQRRKRDGGDWEDVATSVETKLLLSDQPRGVELEYRVVAVNKAGAGGPSGTVAAVL